MAKRKRSRKKATIVRQKSGIAGYGRVLGGVMLLLEQARRSSARAVNTLMTATYWEIGRRIVEQEQHGRHRAGYGEELIIRLSLDLTTRFGRGFSMRNLELMRSFYRCWPIPQTLSANSTRRIPQTLSAGSRKRIVQTPSAQFNDRGRALNLDTLSEAFPLPWSHYVRLLTVEEDGARRFYTTEALRGGWSVRQLDRQISTRFYERTARSRDKVSMLLKGEKPMKGEVLSPEEELRDPFLLEFTGLKDEYSESDLEEALVNGMEHFLLELGNDFAFIGRQRRLRIGKKWYRIDLLFFHRTLRCMVVIDLKVGAFSHADTGQMNLYLNYAREHWMNDGENPPVGIILCTEKDDAVAHYAMQGLHNKMLAREYKLALPDTKKLEATLEKTRKELERRIG